MAGYAGNWYKTGTSGGAKQQAVYLGRPDQVALASRLGAGSSSPAQQRFLIESVVLGEQGQSFQRDALSRHAPPAGAIRPGGGANRRRPGAAVAPGDTLIVQGQSTHILAGAGDYALVQSDSSDHPQIVHVLTGKEIESVPDEATGRTRLARLGVRPSRLVERGLDQRTGRATRTIPGQAMRTENVPTLDDLFDRYPGLTAVLNGLDPDNVSKSMVTPRAPRGDRILAAMQQAQAFDVLPEKVTEGALDQALQTGKVSMTMLRSVKGREQQFLDHDLFSGATSNGRIYGGGIYAAFEQTTSQNERPASLEYTLNPIFAGPDGKAIRMGLRADARVATLETIRANMEAFRERTWSQVQNLPDADPRRLAYEIFSNDPGYLAVAMGYDATHIPTIFEGIQQIVLYNRSAVIAQDTFLTQATL